MCGHTATGAVQLLACAVAAGMAPASHAAAQDISLNYERLSSMEEPIAFEIGDVTFAVTGLRRRAVEPGR